MTAKSQEVKKLGNATPQTANLLVGTYTKNGSKGIYLYHLDTLTGQLKLISESDPVSNPSFLAITKDKQFIQNQGSSIDPLRQTKAHVHGSFFSPDGHWILVNDLGMDQTTIYAYHPLDHPLLEQPAKQVILQDQDI